MKVSKIISLIFVLIFGVFIFIYGGYDDSPGAQGLGLLIFICGVVVMLKSKSKKRAAG